MVIHPLVDLMDRSKNLGLLDEVVRSKLRKKGIKRMLHLTPHSHEGIKMILLAAYNDPKFLTCKPALSLEEAP